MSDLLYYILCAVLVAGVFVGIALMGKVKTAALGNRFSALCMAAAILLTLVRYGILSDPLLWVAIAVALAGGLVWSARVKMIDMPQVVALLNGLGGGASALVVAATFLENGSMGSFERATGALALAVGMITLTGSLVAAGKLHRILSQKPTVLKGHQAVTTATLALSLAAVVTLSASFLPTLSLWGCAILAGLFGVVFSIRIGGADMPITISLLNSLSGVAAGIAGMAVGDLLLVAIGGVVGASGLLLTQIMCRAMNRSLPDILTGKTAALTPLTPVAQEAMVEQKAAAPVLQGAAAGPSSPTAPSAPESRPAPDAAEVLRAAKRVIIVPGYGMALAQAQGLVKQLADRLEQNGAQVDFAIHPVAGRMPGHMNVLLAEADVDYERLREMDEINPLFGGCDAAVIVGANDVVNPAAKEAVGTPIYGMPVLDADHAKHVIVCNYDLKPGYAGVENPLYNREGVVLLIGDAKETLQELLGKL